MDALLADVKFHSQMPFTNVDVCFRNAKELEQLIQALQHLLGAISSDEHITLADPSHYPDQEQIHPDEGLPTTVTFHAPGHRRDSTDLRCLAAARSHLLSLVDEEE
jgi:hypothetical protein